jgi:hypothetical protein
VASKLCDKKALSRLDEVTDGEGDGIEEVLIEPLLMEVWVGNILPVACDVSDAQSEVAGLALGVAVRDASGETGGSRVRLCDSEPERLGELVKDADAEPVSLGARVEKGEKDEEVEDETVAVLARELDGELDIVAECET